MATFEKTSLRQDTVSRRGLLKAAMLHAGAVPLLTSLTESNAFAADKYEPLNHFPRMVQQYFVDQVRASQQVNRSRVARLKTQQEAEDHIALTRAKIRKCFGPEPERTPLNARITGILKRDGYRIEKLIYESRPGFLVTANLYVPSDTDAPLPAVVGTCGHSANGKAYESYQAFAQGLARLGYVCLLYDPIGQGERLQYVDDDLKSFVRSGVMEHLTAGNQQFLVGEFIGAWRAWDGIRALDYLLTRKEVDRRRVGVTGNSGGGTMTTWLAGLDSRWTMAAPSCFVTTFLRNMENELPADTEQCPPRALALGLDHYDFLAALAPKPVRILAKERDYFDVRGSEEALGQLKFLYGLLDAEEHASLATGPTGHGFSQENREAMYDWFGKAAGIEGPTKEPQLKIEKDEDLYCTPRGQVAALGSRTVFSITRERAQEFQAERGAVSGERLHRAARDILKLPHMPDSPPRYRILRYLNSRDYPAPRATAYAVETEPNISALVYRLSDEAWHSRPPKQSTPAILYVSHLSSDAELRDEPLVRELREKEPNVPFYTCDVRGIGESQPNTCGADSFRSDYGCDYFYAIHSLMLDRPYLGQKVYDVLRVVDWVSSHGHESIHLVGKGWGALAATFAAMLSPSVNRVTLKNSLTSYQDIAESELYTWPLATLLPDVLARFDLPDCYRDLEPKQLRQIDPWDASPKQ